MRPGACTGGRRPIVPPGGPGVRSSGAPRTGGDRRGLDGHDRNGGNKHVVGYTASISLAFNEMETTRARGRQADSAAVPPVDVRPTKCAGPRPTTTNGSEWQGAGQREESDAHCHSDASLQSRVLGGDQAQHICLQQRLQRSGGSRDGNETQKPCNKNQECAWLPCDLHGVSAQSSVVDAASVLLCSLISSVNHIRIQKASL